MPVTVDILQAINTSVDQIPYVAGLGPTEPIDYWEYKPEAGKSWVCRDYVEDKAEKIRQLGFDPGNLRVILCWTEPVLPPPNSREYHSVLLVILDGANWILDSRFDSIYLWNDPPVDYRWDRVQISGTDQFEIVQESMIT